MSPSRRLSRTVLPSLALLIAAAAPAAAHPGASTWNDLVFDDRYGLVASCAAGCHGSTTGGLGGNGGMYVDHGTGFPDDEWHKALVGRAPVTGAAATAGKKRVDPGNPWNSFLVDKLTGDLKTGEIDPMPRSTTGMQFQCPGMVEKLVAWILAGSPLTPPQNQPYVPGDPSPGDIVCDFPQPALAAPAPVAGTFPVKTPDLVARRTALGGDREKEGVHRTAVGDGSATFITGIDVLASHGTEYLTITRVDPATGDPEAAPIAVVQGRTLDLELDGAGIPLAAGQEIEIRQLIRNRYWECEAPNVLSNDLTRDCRGTDGLPAAFANVTTGFAYVTLSLASAVDAEATPFLDDLGNQALVVPPNAVGATGGARVRTPDRSASQALVSLWTDDRALSTSIYDLAGGATIEGAAARGYNPVGGTALAYVCQHANGNLNNRLSQLNQVAPGVVPQLLPPAPLRWGCEGNAFGEAPGSPALLGEAAPNCTRSSRSDFIPESSRECGTGNCVAANLVYGTGADDARCALVGLEW